MKKAERITEIDRRLKEAYPKAHIVLGYETDFQLLVAVILSAQTTDVTVNKVTPALFAKYPTAEAMADADLEEFEQDIRPTGFFHNKARNVIGAARMIVAEFGGKVPDTMEELVRLPGVARKTANIVLYNAYGINDGIAVDTHVKRLSQRLGFSAEKTPEKVERDLMKLFPRDEWGTLTYRLIDHGRAVCDAKRPICGECTLAELCPSAFKVKGWRESS
ncbi:MAG: endonuclease III [Coriobacteriia bacterium]|nr:endonuclease III [Coriobacteriia bacterium]MBN2821579.1 endonuclease III [Coriobacteriia bacterium]